MQVSLDYGYRGVTYLEQPRVLHEPALTCALRVSQFGWKQECGKAQVALVLLLGFAGLLQVQRHLVCEPKARRQAG